MYLKSLQIINFRKFKTSNNVVSFVDSQSIQKQKETDEINIAPTTTLIVGKNNSGKTTVIQALDKLINTGAFKANDFNFLYLKELLCQYKVSIDNFVSPTIEFKVNVGIEKNNKDLINNLVPFMTLGDVNKSELEIFIKYELEDTALFIDAVLDLCNKAYEDDSLMFNKFLELIDASKFKINYYNESCEKTSQFKLKDLIELTPIKANNIKDEKCLSAAFSKIIKYRYEIISKGEKATLETSILGINDMLTKSIGSNHTDYINKSLEKIISSDKLKVLLSADLTFQKLMNDLIKYEYVEQNINIPENQFGLGYTNLMMIIAELIEYMEKYPETSFNSKINLISIEEPETYMHPQMQELFIKNINDAITALLEGKHKKVNSQLIVTTHSSHILNSKIHTGNTFNNINYITIQENRAHVVCLSDEKIMPITEDSKKDKASKDGELSKDDELPKDDEINKKEKIAKENDLKFLKKHIKYKVSELFFSDAIILVEGATEDALLPYYIDQHNILNKYYVSIFNINGAHGFVYRELIRLLNVPTLIITDLDIKRETDDDDKTNESEQISDLTGRTTTNETLKKNNKDSDKLDELPDCFQDGNIYIVYQGKIGEYYATSFEEAFILSNYDNRILNETLKKVKPNIYKRIVGKECEENLDKNKLSSYKWQCKLSDCKSDFANGLLYRIVIADDKTSIPLLPKYISDGLDIIAKTLRGDKE